MVVQHNVTAMNSNRMLGVTTGAQAKATEKLSSGYKINRAADDAAGLSISEKMRKQIRGLTQASTNAQDGISAVQTAEGALNEVHDMLQRMNELATKAANGTMSTSDRVDVQKEIVQLSTEIDRVATTTKFNETYLLNGSEKGTSQKKGYGNLSISLQVGADNREDNRIQLKLDAITASSLGVGVIEDTSGNLKTNLPSKVKEALNGVPEEDKLGGSHFWTKFHYGLNDNGSVVELTGNSDVKNGTVKVNAGSTMFIGGAREANSMGGYISVRSTSGARAAIDNIGAAIKLVSARRSQLGSIQNRLEHTIKNLDNVVENTTAAESEIRDTDMAKMMVEFSKNNILQQAGQSMLAQANQSNQGVLSLLG